MQELTEAVTRVHQDILDVMTKSRLEAATRQRLAEVAQEALRLSQKLSKLNTQLVVQQHQAGLLKRAWDFLVRWAPLLTRLKNVPQPDQLGPGN